MTEEKRKKDKRYESEFSFSFSGLADKVSEAINSMGEEPETSYFEEKLGGEEKARVKLDGGIGKLHIHSLDDPEFLVKVETRHIGKMNYSAITDGTEKTVKIENQVMRGGLRGIVGGFGKHRDLYIDVALSTGIPLALNMDGAVGEAVIDLRDLTLTEAVFDGGVGSSSIYLPEGDYKTSIDGGVGPTVLNLPAETGQKIKIEGGVGPMTVHVAPNADLTLDVEGGVGPVVINLPAGTPVMVEYERGLGPFQRPSALVQKNKNTWATEGYDLADRSVYIKLEGGVGPSKINFTGPNGEAKSKAKTSEA